MWKEILYFIFVIILEAFLKVLISYIQSFDLYCSEMNYI